MSNHLLAPVCWVLGHVEVESEDKPGWFNNACGRCGLGVFSKFPPIAWYERFRYGLPKTLVAIANTIEPRNGLPTDYPRYRAVNQHIDGIGGKYSAASFSYEHIKSLLEQYKGDGLPEPLLSHLIDESGWISIEDVGAEKFAEIINKDFERESNKREREETMKKTGEE